VSKPIRKILEQVRATVCPPMAEPLPVEFRMAVGAPIPYEPHDIEECLGLVLPEPLTDLWSVASSVELFRDVTYGQWGLVLWDPRAALAGTRGRRTRPADQRPGDLLLGEFLGDVEKLLLRCDVAMPDFGRVVVEPGLDRREDWKTVGDSLADFLTRYLEAGGEKFWTRELTHPL
jgi:hypothetical protein